MLGAVSQGVKPRSASTRFSTGDGQSVNGSNRGLIVLVLVLGAVSQGVKPPSTSTLFGTRGGQSSRQTEVSYRILAGDS